MSDNIRPAGRDVTNVRHVVAKWNREVILVDDATFNPEWHEEIQNVARDPKVAAAQQAVLQDIDVNP